MVKIFEQKSIEEGTWSRLPVMTEEQKQHIRGTGDFFGINYYTSKLVSPKEAPDDSAQFDHDVGITFSKDEKWATGKASWQYIVPEGLYDLLIWIRDKYDNPKMLITENGFTDSGEMNDVGRIRYLKQHLAAALKAKKEKCNIVGYTVWSLIDNFEWTDGYTIHLGLFAVNMSSPYRERTPKRSARFFRDLITNRKFEVCDEGKM
jgi:beta-glucosidase/6-phospho-beta-glucosidase/beta-galactosidase